MTLVLSFLGSLVAPCRTETVKHADEGCTRRMNEEGRIRKRKVSHLSIMPMEQSEGHTGKSRCACEGSSQDDDQHPMRYSLIVFLELV